MKCMPGRYTHTQRVKMIKKMIEICELDGWIYTARQRMRQDVCVWMVKFSDSPVQTRVDLLLFRREREKKKVQWNSVCLTEIYLSCEWISRNSNQKVDGYDECSSSCFLLSHFCKIGTVSCCTWGKLVIRQKLGYLTKEPNILYWTFPSSRKYTGSKQEVSKE